MARTRDLVREMKRVGDALAQSPGVSQSARDRWMLASAEIMRDAVPPRSMGAAFADEAVERASRCIDIARVEGVRGKEAIEDRALALINYKDSQLDAIEAVAHAGLAVTRRDDADTL